jgi:hypothetical protein
MVTANRQYSDPLRANTQAGAVSVDSVVKVLWYVETPMTARHHRSTAKAEVRASEYRRVELEPHCDPLVTFPHHVNDLSVVVLPEAEMLV